MTTIELNSYYPHLTKRITLEVSDEIAVTLSIGGRCCDSYKHRKREHDECSLDGTPGFEANVTRPPLTPEEVMERAEEQDALYLALDQLPPLQAPVFQAQNPCDSDERCAARMGVPRR